MLFYSLFILNVEKVIRKMNSSFEDIVAFIGILMFLLAIKIMIRIRNCLLYTSGYFDIAIYSIDTIFKRIVFFFAYYIAILEMANGKEVNNDIWKSDSCG